jgi:hypothetical protein
MGYAQYFCLLKHPPTDYANHWRILGSTWSMALLSTLLHLLGPTGKDGRGEITGEAAKGIGRGCQSFSPWLGLASGAHDRCPVELAGQHSGFARGTRGGQSSCAPAKLVRGDQRSSQRRPRLAAGGARRPAELHGGSRTWSPRPVNLSAPGGVPAQRPGRGPAAGEARAWRHSCGRRPAELAAALAAGGARRPAELHDGSRTRSPRPANLPARRCFCGAQWTAEVLRRPASLGDGEEEAKIFSCSTACLHRCCGRTKYMGHRPFYCAQPKLANASCVWVMSGGVGLRLVALGAVSQRDGVLQ